LTYCIDRPVSWSRFRNLCPFRPQPHCDNHCRSADTSINQRRLFVGI